MARCDQSTGAEAQSQCNDNELPIVTRASELHVCLELSPTRASRMKRPRVMCVQVCVCFTNSHNYSCDSSTTGESQWTTAYIKITMSIVCTCGAGDNS